MVWDDHAVALTIKAIGTVESGLVYDAINYNDPITIGVAQWYGARAAGLMELLADADPTRWNNVADSLQTELSNRGTSTWWNSRYLSPHEGNSLKPILVNNKDVQNTLFADDISDYVNVLHNLGFDVEGSTDAAIFFCTVYHQSPQAALQIVNRVGLSPSLNQIHAAALNNSIVGRYRNRQNEVKAIIESGDTTGVDDIPGEESPGIGGGDNDNTDTRLRGNITRISVQGDNLHIHLRNSSSQIIAYPNGSGTWITGLDPTTGANPVPPEDGPDPDPPGEGAGDDLVQWMVDREETLRYSRGPDRNNPDVTGAGDCSSVVRQAYLDVVGIDIGSWTGEQYTNGTRIQSGTQGVDYPDPALLQPGDLLFSLQGWSGRTTTDHVEMVMNGTTTIGHAGEVPLGPNRWSINAQLDWAVSGGTWYVQRYI